MSVLAGLDPAGPEYTRASLEESVWTLGMPSSWKPSTQTQTVSWGVEGEWAQGRCKDWHCGVALGGDPPPLSFCCSEEFISSKSQSLPALSCSGTKMNDFIFSQHETEGFSFVDQNCLVMSLTLIQHLSLIWGSVWRALLPGRHTGKSGCFFRVNMPPWDTGAFHSWGRCLGLSELSFPGDEASPQSGEEWELPPPIMTGTGKNLQFWIHHNQQALLLISTQCPNAHRIWYQALCSCGTRKLHLSLTAELQFNWGNWPCLFPFG